jgi:predicted dehydrogenase
VYFEFRLFRDFSGGIPDQWYSHASGLVHFYLDTFIADETVASGGIFAWHDVRENPDTFQCLSTFRKQEVLHTFSTTFGNAFNRHTIIQGTRGTLHCPGGEGSPQWWFTKEPYSGWGSNLVFETKGPRPMAEPVTIPGHPEPVPIRQGDDLKAHTDDWFRAMRSRGVPNGHIDTGFAHAVAVVMANRAYREGKRMYWDRTREEIVDHPV